MNRRANNMKFKRIPFVGFYLYVLSLVLLIVGYVISMSAFQAFSLDVDRFVLIFPIFAMWIIIVQVVMSFVDVNKPLWMGAADLLFCFLVLFAFGRVLIPFLTPIGEHSSFYSPSAQSPVPLTV